ncbi:MAG: CPBP family glutamic-type intramembrane protease, partial [Terracidiphilus sp.]
MMESHASLPQTQEIAAQEQPIASRSRRRDAMEIGVAYALILAVEWTSRPLQGVLWLVAVTGLALIIWRSFDGGRAMGFRLTNLGRSLWISGAALALAAIFISAADRMHTLRVAGGIRAFIASFFAYAIWSGVQQILLQGVFLLRFLRLIARPAAAAFVASTFFALAHVPNPVLTPITLLWGFVACLLFLRYRNIYPLMIAHAVLGIA